jgi:hypothetical protein
MVRRGNSDIQTIGPIDGICFGGYIFVLLVLQKRKHSAHQMGFEDYPSFRFYLGWNRNRNRI